MRVACLGDLLVDVVVRLERPLAPGGDAPARTRLGAGGQAANVAAWAAHLGAEARFLGKRSGDAAGRLAADELRSRGVAVLGPEVDGGSGAVVALVGPDGERTMASDRGVAPDLAAAELDAAWLEGCDWLHVSGYALMRHPIAAAARRAAELTRAGGGRVSVDLASWSVIRAYGPGLLRAELATLAPDLVLANEAERAALGGDLGAPEWVLKRGAAGCVAVLGGERLELPAHPAEVVDTTGAGDALAAGVLLGGAPEEALERGLAAAAACVGRLGAMP
ncbi:MAG TPA: PfkB family carbohydrate kinase [Miltoncostaeaceae bacterium]|nr:PfkB family carbohydrate kinase [Miltoncostaeaceae bacterium]